MPTKFDEWKIIQLTIRATVFVVNLKISCDENENLVKIFHNVRLIFLICWSKIRATLYPDRHVGF